MWGCVRGSDRGVPPSPAPRCLPEGTAGVPLGRSLPTWDERMFQDRCSLHAASVSHDETHLLKREQLLPYPLRTRQSG
jgi:hypothetical protein